MGVQFDLGAFRPKTLKVHFTVLNNFQFCRGRTMPGGAPGGGDGGEGCFRCGKQGHFARWGISTKNFKYKFSSLSYNQVYLIYLYKSILFNQAGATLNKRNKIFNTCRTQKSLSKSKS